MDSIPSTPLSRWLLPSPGISHRLILSVPLVCSSLLLLGVLDYATGVELRVYPLYFLPLGLAAARFAAWVAATTAVLATAIWGGSNWLAGVAWSPWLWPLNILSQLTAFLVFVLLVSRLKSQVHRERMLARTDPLTGLLNSRGFFELAERELARQRRKLTPVVVAYFDLDDFKHINERLGHLGADRLLAAIGATLKESLRDTDVAARLGGDEFAVLLPDTDEPAGRIVVERLRTNVARAAKAFAYEVTFSTGALAFTEAAPDVNAILREADSFMYHVKRSGKNAVELRLSARPTAAADEVPFGRPRVTPTE